MIRIGLILMFLIAPIIHAQAPENTLPENFYLGDDLYLTSLSRITPPSDALYMQLWHYDADGVMDRGEEIVDEWVCGTSLAEHDQGNCTPFLQLAGGELLYANRAYDLAIIKMAKAEDTPPLILDGRIPLYANTTRLELGTLIENDLPFTLLYQTIVAQRGDSFSDEGYLLGIPIGKGYISPVWQWLDELRAANEQIQSPELAAVLERAIVPDAVEGLSTSGDLYAPELGNSGIDVLHYELDLRFDMSRFTIEAGSTATLNLKITQQQLASFTLDLQHMVIDEVLINGESAMFRQTTRKARITLPEPLLFGTEIEVAIAYHGNLKPSPSPYFGGYPNGVVLDEEQARLAFLSEPDGSSVWFPCNDHPLDAATYDFHITVDQPFEAVSNGQLLDIAEHADGKRTFHWHMPDLMASYLATVAIADYVLIEDRTADGIPLSHYVYNLDNLDEMKQVFSITPQAMNVLQTFFGVYPFKSYGHVITPLGGGALETQTMTAMPYTLDTSRGMELVWGLVVHELAHQWFGNAVRLGAWQDIWLNEGFATFAEWLDVETRIGESSALRQRNNAEQGIIRSNRATPLAYPHQNEMFSQDSYDKGAWMLHMLRVELGDAVFFPMLQAYYVAFAGDSVTTLAFFQFVERYTDQDLTAFRQQWLEQAGVPQHDLYVVLNTDSVTLQLCDQREQIYDVQLPILLRNGTDQMLEFTMPLNSKEPITFETDFAVQTVDVDPQQQILNKTDMHVVDRLEGCG